MYSKCSLGVNQFYGLFSFENTIILKKDMPYNLMNQFPFKLLVEEMK